MAAESFRLCMLLQDAIMSGMSTAYVEFSETAAALNRATPASLVVLDELGRGTATTYGVAIAAAVLEHLSHRVGCRWAYQPAQSSGPDGARPLFATKHVQINCCMPQAWWQCHKACCCPSMLLLLCSYLAALWHLLQCLSLPVSAGACLPPIFTDWQMCMLTTRQCPSATWPAPCVMHPAASQTRSAFSLSCSARALCRLIVSGGKQQLAPLLGAANMGPAIPRLLQLSLPNHLRFPIMQVPDICFLYKLTEGACPKSYGTNVARLAGLPDAIVQRAAEFSASLEREHNNSLAVVHSDLAKAVAQIKSCGAA